MEGLLIFLKVGGGVEFIVKYPGENPNVQYYKTHNTIHKYKKIKKIFSQTKNWNIFDNFVSAFP